MGEGEREERSQGSLNSALLPKPMHGGAFACAGDRETAMNEPCCRAPLPWGAVSTRDKPVPALPAVGRTFQRHGGKAGAGRREAGWVSEGEGAAEHRLCVPRSLPGAEGVAGPGPVRLPALRPGGRARLPQAQRGPGGGSGGHRGPVRPPRYLRAPGAEHARPPPGRREGGQGPGAGGDSGTGPRRPRSSRPPLTAPAQWGGMTVAMVTLL